MPYKESYTSRDLERIAQEFESIGATLRGIATAIKRDKVEPVDLKLGTATGVHFRKCQECVIKSVAAAQIAVKRASSTKKKA